MVLRWDGDVIRHDPLGSNLKSEISPVPEDLSPPVGFSARQQLDLQNPDQSCSESSSPNPVADQSQIHPGYECSNSCMIIRILRRHKLP
jgi:hypothetical protein